MVFDQGAFKILGDFAKILSMKDFIKILSGSCKIKVRILQGS